MNDEITPAFIAAWKDWSRSTAWRWLRELQAKHGDAVVKKRGRLIYTTRAGLAKIGEDLPPSVDIRTERRLRAIEDTQRQEKKRADGFAYELSSLKRDVAKALQARSERHR